MPHSFRLTWADPITGDQREFSGKLPVTIGRATQNTIVLHSSLVSRQHARLDAEGDHLLIHDLGSTNGVLINGQQIKQARLTDGELFQIGPFTFSVLLEMLPPPGVKPPPDPLATQKQKMGEAPLGEPAAVAATFPPPSFSRFQIVPLEELKKLPYSLEEISYLTVGGGIGSFIWADYLVIAGVKPEQIVALGAETKPYARLQRLALNSQIPAEERLRSTSEACPDNLWGWPGYGLREMWRELKRGNLAQAARIVWQLFGEPDLSETYAPLSGDVFAAMDREAARIGWERIWRFGRVRAIRKTDDDRYVVAYSQTRPGEGRVHKLILTSYLHLAVGYPAVRFLPDLQQYREQTNDFKSVVNAYEDHHHIYEHLRLHGGTVLLRGRGIVASRIIHRLYETRKVNADITITHLMQTPTFKGSQYGRAKRLARNHWEFQPYNWPKAAWGGDLRFQLERVTEDERDQLLNDWGGTTTTNRRDWMKVIDRGLHEGWYKIRFGHVERVERDEKTHKLATVIRGRTTLEGHVEMLADFIIDATGFVANLENNPVLNDLVTHYHLPRNIKERLKVNVDFEIPEMQNGSGRVFASGATTLGSAFAPVDSFLGMQYAALRSLDLLAGLNAPGVRPLNVFRSIAQWFRWIKGVAP